MLRPIALLSVAAVASTVTLSSTHQLLRRSARRGCLAYRVCTWSGSAYLTLSAWRRRDVTSAAAARAYLARHRQGAPDVARLEALLDAGTSPPDTVLLLAARLGDLSAVRAALAAGAAPAVSDTEGSTPAMRAASRGHVEVLRVLLETDAAGLEAVNHWGYSVEIYAGSVKLSLPSAYREMMALLREFGVEDPVERAERRWTQAPKLTKPS